MSHSKYYKQAHKGQKGSGNLAGGLFSNKKILLIIAAVIVVAFISFGFKLSQMLQEKNAENNKEYGEIKNFKVITREKDDEGNFVEANQEVKIIIANVGHGQAILVDADQTEIVIDGGSKASEKKVIKTFEPYIDGNIEFVINTASGDEHVGGLPALYEKFSIENTIYGSQSETEAFKLFKDAALHESGSVIIRNQNKNINISDGIALSVLNKECKGTNENNKSLICVLKYNGESRAIITGDAEAEEEAKLCGEIEDVDLYVAGNHGADTSSTKVLLNELRPQYAVISADSPKKNLKFASAEIIARMEDISAETYCTYKAGDIYVSINEQEATITFENKKEDEE